MVDDESIVRRTIARYLRARGFEVEEATDGRHALEVLRQQPVDLCLLDLMMPRMGGLEALRELRRAGQELPVIILTALQDVESAVEATRLGATEYLTKPFEPAQVVQSVEACLARQAQARRRTTGAQGVVVGGYEGLLGQAPAMQSLFALLQSLEGIAPPTVLITGESGVGKDVVARAVHARGPRARQPFVEVDCTAIPENLMESTLFGHEKGAFTGAARQHQGLFEVARGGVVFLDEIGELPAPAQAKLLRALENRRFKRVGGTQDIEFDACVLAATNRDLQAEVRGGRFREDLFYRLAIIPIHVPPLRQRAEDIPLLAEAFLRRFAEQFGKPVPALAPAALDALLGHGWPGNVRELRNLMERLVVFGRGPALQLEELPADIRYRAHARAEAEPAAGRRHRFLLPEEGVALDDVERSLIEQALERTQFNQSHAARLVGLTRFGLRNRMKKYGWLQR